MAIATQLPINSEIPQEHQSSQSHSDNPVRCFYWRNHVINFVRIGGTVALGYGAYKSNLASFGIGLTSWVGECIITNHMLQRLPNLEQIQTSSKVLETTNQQLRITLHQFQKSIEEEEKEENSMAQHLQEFGNQNSQIQRLEIKIENDTKTIQALQQQLDNSTNRYHEDTLTLKADVEKLELLNKSQESQMKQLTRQVAEYTTVITRLEQENQNLRNHTDKFDETATRAKKELTENLEKMHQQYIEAEALERTLRDTIKKHELHLETKRTELQQLNSHTDAAIANLQAEETKLAHIHKEIIAATKQLTDYVRIREEVETTETMIRDKLVALEERERLLNILAQAIEQKTHSTSNPIHYV